MEASNSVPYAVNIATVQQQLQANPDGLAESEVERRLKEYGSNRLPEVQPASIVVLFLRQFLSPLIYILLAAAAFSLWMLETSDAVFIGAVLLINAAIGTFQEYTAEKAAHALKHMVPVHAMVLRGGKTLRIDAENLVPGDIVLLASGDKVPADIRLIETDGLLVDESLLTGESVPVAKQEAGPLPEGTPLAERKNMVFAATLIGRGRGKGMVISTGIHSEIGRIASSVAKGESTKPPLLTRIDHLTLRLALVMLIVIAALFAITLLKGHSLIDMIPVAIALGVAAVPEGMPAAITVALAIAMRRMAARNVIIRNMAAVETLGSCTYIASDKTGTLTLNEITVERVVLPDGAAFMVEGNKIEAEGSTSPQHTSLDKLCLAGALANEATEIKHGDGWHQEGDKVDISLLVFCRKWGFSKDEALALHPPRRMIPYESEQGFSAAISDAQKECKIFVKGSVEKLLSMCKTMQGNEGIMPLNTAIIETQMQALADQGYRVLAFAEGTVPSEQDIDNPHTLLHELTFLGLAGMIDPLRPEAKDAVARCHEAGIRAAMVTGDHPVTALAIARQLGLADQQTQAVTGAMLKEAQQQSDGRLKEMITGSTVFARIEPEQKRLIVECLMQGGHYVAVTGDGVNDAPALKAAHVGVAMGARGTDVARESADIVLTDDNFASIVEGVREGRVVYGNIRKVIFHFVSIGMAEILLFLLAISFGLPMPLTTVQLLWLNLVTGGLQDLPLTLEKAEGEELKKSPRPVNEPVFNRLMIERVALNAVIIGLTSFGAFSWLLNLGYAVEDARNIVLLLMVLFENVQVLNSRSETRSIFRQPFFSNPLLLVGMILAQGIHIAAMHLPFMQDILAVKPMEAHLWGWLLGISIFLLLINEGYKLWIAYTLKVKKA
jgi:P-type Ca2+ transporter type 2C